MEIAIECQTRPEGTKPRALRRSGFIPAVLYGHNGTESLSLTVDENTVSKLLKDASVNNTLIDLKIADSDWSGKALLREVQSHPWKGHPYHLSFFSISAQASVEVEVPVVCLGEAVGVKTEGGVLETLMMAVTVKCAPDKIPGSIEVEISDLHVGQALHVSDLGLPEGVEVVSEPKQVVVSIQGIRGSKTAAAEAGDDE